MKNVHLIYLYTECKPINKECNEIEDTKCSQCKTSPPNSKCSYVEAYGCRDVEINELCKIDENGKCVLVTASDTGKCHYNYTKF